MTTKHRAQIIETYPDIGKCAARFSWRGRERVECVPMYLGPDCLELKLGMRGWISYHSTNSQGAWSFEMYKAA